MPLGNYTIGTGNISAYTVNANVTGTGTTFFTQLSSGAAIANASNVFVGYVSYITSNTSLVLTSNANVAVSTSESYNYAQYVANIGNITYNCVGNIIASTTTNLVFGNNTAFISNLNVGDSIYIANGNITSSALDIKIGTVELILDQATLILSSNSTANIGGVNGSQFYKLEKQYYYNPSYPTHKIDNILDYEPRDISAGLTVLHGTMWDWVQTGLIPNVSVVSKYHPPVRDSVTGIMVHLPASIYTNTLPPLGANGDIYSSTLVNGVRDFDYTHPQGIGGIAGAGPNYNLHDFDHDDRAFGTDVSHVHKKLINSHELRKLTDLDNDAQYQDAIKKLVPTTHVDGFASLIGANIAKVTDSLSDAKEYFSRVGGTAALKEQGGINFNNDTSDRLRKPPIDLKKLVPTNAPIAIPGLLNVKVETDEPKNTEWVPVQYRPTNVK